MNYDDARATVLRTMKPLAENEIVLGVPARLADELTEEHEWGWLFVFVPVDPEGCKSQYTRVRFALDRTNGNTTPVGNKGIPEALRDLLRWRKPAEPAE